jgi:prephenate dehydrogenase
MDTSRIASGPVNIWADVLLTNPDNVATGIDRTISELLKLKRAVEGRDKKQVEGLLKSARNKRSELIKYKMKRKELIP